MLHTGSRNCYEDMNSGVSRRINFENQCNIYIYIKIDAYKWFLVLCSENVIYSRFFGRVPTHETDSRSARLEVPRGRRSSSTLLERRAMNSTRPSCDRVICQWCFKMIDIQTEENVRVISSWGVRRGIHTREGWEGVATCAGLFVPRSYYGN